ncbi:hypothetical protein ACS77_04645 [Pseudomonas syringae]|uniref:Short NACHT-associated C-terminal domain-containing protein n=1 Tax=Pseudomonas syringae TaxID=317 RepID=A0A0L1ML13_PSESX|nr:hypothetical protein ACS77_04645 [Pseudomonas syringae]
MKHLFLDCIRDKRYVPIMVELRDINAEKISIDDFIRKVLDESGFDTNGEYVKKAMVAGHFCFFFDGYDEVDHDLRTQVIRQIGSLSNKYPECPLILSSRPDDVFNGLNEFNVFRIMPLSLESASDLIAKLPFDEDVKTKFQKDLAESLFERHNSFLSNPLLLSIMLLTYGENAEIPSKQSIFYNQAYEALFQRHDANKGAYTRVRLTNLDIQDFARVFSLFSVQTFQKRLFKMSRSDCLAFIDKSRDSLKKDFKAQDYLGDLLSAACLLIEDGLDVAFSHRSFQEYFVALYLSTAAPEIQEKLIKLYWDNMSSDSVLSLLYEINPELVERVLLVPELEQFFSLIGVRNKVGITHAARYLKMSFLEFNVDPSIFHATPIKPTKKYSRLDKIGRFVREYVFKQEDVSGEYVDEVTREMYEKYGSGVPDQVVAYPTKGLTYKSEFLLDVMNTRGNFSKSNIDDLWVYYKKIKSSNDNKVLEINKMLGIR